MRQFLIAFCLFALSSEISAQEITLTGRITDVDTKEWISNAHILITKKGKVVYDGYTLSDGTFNILLKNKSEYLLYVTKNGFRSLSQNLVLGELKVQKQNYIKIYLEREGIKAKGRVYEAQMGIPIPNVKIYLANTNLKTRRSIRTDINGEYLFKLQKDVNYSLKIDTIIDGNQIQKFQFSTVNMSTDDDIIKNFELNIKLPNMEEFLQKARAQRREDSIKKAALATNAKQAEKIVVPEGEVVKEEKKEKFVSDFVSSYSEETEDDSKVNKSADKKKEKKEKKHSDEAKAPEVEKFESKEKNVVQETKPVAQEIKAESPLASKPETLENAPLATAKIDTRIKKTLTIDDYNEQVSSGTLDPSGPTKGTATVQSLDASGTENIYVKDNSIYYPAGKALLNKEAIDFLVRQVELIKEAPQKKLLIEVFSDANQEYTIKDYICRLRGEEVVGYLINNGLPFDKMNISNIGYKILANDCAKDVPCSEEQHQENRRVRLSITDASAIEFIEIKEEDK